jgi:hypothetical protein
LIIQTLSTRAQARLEAMVRMPYAQEYEDEFTSDDPEAFQVRNTPQDAPLGLDEYIESLSSLLPSHIQFTNQESRGDGNACQ